MLQVIYQDGYDKYKFKLWSDKYSYVRTIEKLILSWTTDKKLPMICEVEE